MPTRGVPIDSSTGNVFLNAQVADGSLATDAEMREGTITDKAGTPAGQRSAIAPAEIAPLHVFSDFRTLGTPTAGQQIRTGQQISVTTDSGGAGTVTTPNTWEKADGGAVYLHTQDGAPPESAFVEFSFTPGTTTNAVLAIILSPHQGADGQVDIVLPDSIHIVINPAFTQLDTYRDAVGTNRVSEVYADLDADTRYRLDVRRIANNKLRLTLPTGVAITYTEPVDAPGLIERCWGGTVLVELLQFAGTLATDMNPRIHSFGDSGTWYRQPTATYWQPATNGNNVTCPDSAALDIVGDLCVAAKIAPDDWSPAADRVIVSKLDVAGQYSWYFVLNTAGELYLSYSADGTNLLPQLSTANLSALANGETVYVAVTLDVDNGAGGHDTRFWYSADGSVWAQLGATVTAAGVASIFSSTSQIMVGDGLMGAFLPFAGQIGEVSIRSGFGIGGLPGGTEVAKWDASTSPSPRYRDGYGNVWTPNGSEWAWMAA